MAIWFVSALLLLTLILLITERLPVDLTAIGIMIVLMVGGILTPAEAMAGLASPAVITVAAMFLISKGMIRTGAVGYVSRSVMRSAGGRPGHDGAGDSRHCGGWPRPLSTTRPWWCSSFPSS
jgi:di/tricarboxylate transporter